MPWHTFIPHHVWRRRLVFAPGRGKWIWFSFEQSLVVMKETDEEALKSEKPSVVGAWSRDQPSQSEIVIGWHFFKSP